LDLLKTLLALFEVEIVLCLFTMILMVLPGIAGVGAVLLIRWAILSGLVTADLGWVGGRGWDLTDWLDEKVFL